MRTLTKNLCLFSKHSPSIGNILGTSEWNMFELGATLNHLTETGFVDRNTRVMLAFCPSRKCLTWRLSIFRTGISLPWRFIG